MAFGSAWGMAGSRIAKVALAGVSLASINTTLHAQTADPQTAAVQSAGTVNVSVPAGSLESGLLGLGRQTNLRMVYRSNLTAGKRTAGVSGQMTPPQAVRQLLAGTGLSAAFTTANTVQVYDPSAPVDVGALPSGAIPLPTISVTGQGEGTAEHGYRVETAKTTGLWGNKPIIDTPYSINVTSAELMQNRIVGSNDELLKFNPMVQLTRPTSAFGAPTVMIRGFDQTTASGFVLDGVPVRYSWLGGGMEDMERIEVLSGLSGFLYGANNVGGMVNYVTKRPTVTPLFNFTVGNYGGSQYFEHLDLGGPLDKEGKFAYRFNALYQDGNDAIGVGQRRANFSGAVDWNVTDSLKVSITAAHDDYRRTGTGGVGISFSTPGPIPSAKDFDNTRPLTPNWGFNYLKQDRVGANVQWDIDDETTLRAAALYLKETRFSSSPQPMGVLANGTYSFQAFRVFGPESNINGGYLYVDRKFDTFGIRHKVTFGTNFSGYDQYTFQNPPGASGTFPTLAAALNSAPLVFNSVYPFPGHRAVNFKNTNIVLGDDITLNRYFSILVGANRATIETYNYDTTGATTAAYDKSAVTPSASLIFKPTSNVSLYGTYIESLESGGTVSLTNIPPYTNAGAVLPATISKQVEVGAKANVGGVFLTLAAFQIDKANLYDTANPDGTLTRNQDGRQIHKGIELTATGKVTDDLTIMGGGYYLDPEVTKTNNAALLGKEPQRVSRWRGSLWGEYRLPVLKTLFLTGGVSYVGSSYVDAVNTILVPSYTVGDVGLRYETAVNGTPVVMRLNVQNVADNHYWVNGSVLYQGLPRTYSFSATAKF